MTTHGAYTQTQKHARMIKELGGKVQRNLKALFSTGEQLAADAELTAQLETVNELLKRIMPVMVSASEKTAATAEHYLKDKTSRKGYVLQTAKRVEIYEGTNKKRTPRPRTRGIDWR